MKNRKSYLNKDLKVGDRVWWWSQTEDYSDDSKKLIEHIFSGRIIDFDSYDDAKIELDEKADLNSDKFVVIHPLILLHEGDEYPIDDAVMMFSEKLLVERYGEESLDLVRKIELEMELNRERK